MSMQDAIDRLKHQLGQPCLDTADGDAMLRMIADLDDRLTAIEQKLEAKDSYEREQAEHG